MSLEAKHDLQVIKFKVSVLMTVKLKEEIVDVVGEIAVLPLDGLDHTADNCVVLLSKLTERADSTRHLRVVQT